ncbi:MAG: CoA transferase [Syntrophales bacterium]|nr:CoA transferase [Syntrophales bacterium]MCK9527370.1 CoA transferase [Syntrophales bacterium]MDX9921472.1 CoA transferase [Syntrophales bacterium]
MISTASQGMALEGVRVLDLTIAYNGPFCTMNLADHGAEVIKIERPVTGDGTRWWPPFREGRTGINDSGYYAFLNRNKKGITLDLQSEEGKRVFKELVKTADVVVNNFKAGTMEKLGLSYEVLKEVNPRIIYAATSGFGSYGPFRDRPAYDIIAQALGGLMSICGYPDGPPVKVGPAVGDNFTGTYLALGIVMALYKRKETGVGQMVEVAMTDTVVSILEAAIIAYTMTGTMHGRVGNIDPFTTPFDMFRCKEGDYLVIAASSDALWEKLCHVMGRPDMLEDERLANIGLRCDNYFSIIEPVMREWAESHACGELESMLADAGIPCAPVLEIDQVVNHPNTRAREMIVKVEHPTLGTLEIPGIPIKMFGTPGRIRMPSPLLGQHNEEIFGELDFSDGGEPPERQMLCENLQNN